jgi:hypothetical protein
LLFGKRHRNVASRPANIGYQFLGILDAGAIWNWVQIHTRPSDNQHGAACHAA